MPVRSVGVGNFATLTCTYCGLCQEWPYTRTNMRWRSLDRQILAPKFRGSGYALGLTDATLSFRAYPPGMILRESEPDMGLTLKIGYFQEG